MPTEMKKQERMRGSDGRFKARRTRAVLPEEIGAREGAAITDKPVRPGQSGEYIRKTLSHHLPEILRGLIDGARHGSCPHVKLATDLLQPAQKPVKRKTHTLSRLLRKYQQEEKRVEKTPE